MRPRVALVLGIGSMLACGCQSRSGHTLGWWLSPPGAEGNGVLYAADFGQVPESQPVPTTGPTTRATTGPARPPTDTRPGRRRYTEPSNPLLDFLIMGGVLGQLAPAGEAKGREVSENALGRPEFRGSEARVTGQPGRVVVAGNPIFQQGPPLRGGLSVNLLSPRINPAASRCGELAVAGLVSSQAACRDRLRR